MLVHQIRFIAYHYTMDNQFIKDNNALVEEPPHKVCIATQSLRNNRKFRNSSVFLVDEIHVDPLLHSHIIGRKGTMLNRIQRETCTSIFFPAYLKRVGETVPPDVIRIEGCPTTVSAAKRMILQIVADQAERSVTKTIKIDQVWHEKIKGPNGRNLEELCEKFTDVRVNFPEPGSSSCDVTLVGPRDKIEGCADYLEETVRDMAVTPYCAEVRIDKKFHSHVVGQGGSNLQRIRQASRAWLRVPDAKSDSETIVIFGVWRNVEKARLMILETVNNVATYRNGPKEEVKKATSISTNTAEEPLQCETYELNSVVGEEVDNELWEKFISHPPDGMQAFLELIPEEFLVKVPREFHKCISGDLGQIVRTKAEQCEVTLKVPHASTESDSILLRGPPSKCAEVKEALLLLVENLAAREEERKRRSYCETIRIDPLHYAVLVGRHGIGIVKYHRKHNVNLHLGDKENAAGEREIAIVGYEHRVKAAKEDMLRFLEEFDARVTVEVKIDPRVYSRIIGPGGNRVVHLQRQFGVKIRFPQKGSDVVKVFGPKEKVDNAKCYLRHLENIYTAAPAANDTGGGNCSNNLSRKRAPRDLLPKP